MANDAVDPAAPGLGSEERVVFDYIKSPSFRSLHVDGLMGGVTPNGHLHFAFYCERPALPQRQTFKLTSAGTLAGLIDEETVSRGGVVRELEIDAFVTLDVANQMRDWLNLRIEELERRNEMVAELLKQNDL